MRTTGPPSRHFDPARVEAPERRGEVAWSLFNEHYHRLQTLPWSRINEGAALPFHRRAARLLMAWFIQRTGAVLDLRRKAAVLARFPIPRDPDVIFFGAEVGWEAALVRALFGDGGRLVLVDCDPAAYRRFLEAPAALEVRGPGGRRLVLSRERAEYVRADFFEHDEPAAFDVGLDWGLLEHFPGERKTPVLARFRDFLRDGGVQISAVPRDAFGTRAFYRAFGDELNFGYRELLEMDELEAALVRGGFEVLARAETPTTCVALSRPVRA
jgi:hypothetical protein